MKGFVKLVPSEIFQEIRFSKTFGPYWTDKGEIEKDFAFNAFYSGFKKNLLALIELNGIVPNKVTQEMKIKIADITLTVDSLQ